ncbi:triple tyrosine motif-containing protein [Pedobacter sp. ASV28]|uniref:ligand-binding sensor domain-containing protein n=1 Tax=Pedobacter sp. ASV28 TaxID=2795123 RepID=UPI0018EBF3C9|nr:triple tyrosine motif-containing protein [Pedobacter sp. ASV28]
MKYTSFLILIFIGCLRVAAQNPIGIPQINMYSSLDYKGGSQNWDIDQDQNGLLYFANNEGLLVFDGRNWKLYSLPHKTVVRSIKIASDGKIYVGAQDEIGYFFPDQNGRLVYHSIRNIIPEQERKFSDIWDISIINNEIFFRSTNKILQLKNGKITVHKPRMLWEFMGECNHKIYAQDIATGLNVYQNGKWQNIAAPHQLQDDYVTAILNFSPDTLLVTTLRKGAFLVGKDFVMKKVLEKEEELLRNKMYKAIAIKNNWIAIATSAGGTYIMDRSGKMIQQFSSEEGLYKNNIRSIFMDRNGNFWLGLDDGINFIAFNNAIKYVYPDKAKQTSSYFSLIDQDQLYVGTSNGVYRTPLQSNVRDLSYSRNFFKEVENTNGQVWELSKINGQILVGHEEGALVIEGKSAKRIYSSPGTWLFTQPWGDSTIIAGTYFGLHKIAYRNGVFTNAGNIQGLNESLRFLVVNHNMLWASHPYRGIFRLKLSADKRKVIETKFYDERSGLPSLLGNSVAKIRNRVVVATQKGIFEYEEKTDRFVHSAFLRPILKDNIYHYLKEDKSGNIWFISHKKVGLIDFHAKTPHKAYTIVHLPELNSLVVAGFEHIYPYDDENVFIGAKKGLIHINYKEYSKNIRPVNVNLSLVKAIGEKNNVIFGGYFLSDGKMTKTQNIKERVELDKQFNSLHFEYSSTLYEQQNNIEFSYQLVGSDKTWSQWSGKNEKDYTNLPYGDYIFKVKARNNLGSESEIATYTFYIKPAWYETFWVYVFYAAVMVGVVNFLIQRQKRKHKKEQDHLKHMHQLEIDSNEKQIVKLQNDKLEAEVNFKNKELATMGMNLVQKNKLLTKVREEISQIGKTSPAGVDFNSYIKKVIRLLNEAEKGDADWEQFSMHFDHVHSNFLSKLKEKFPNLGANDLKLCAYLKMNLSSKEIAQLMGISSRAVEVSRYRLRKKIQVPQEMSLFDYLIQATSEK